jgi:hypothetical protein
MSGLKNYQRYRVEVARLSPYFYFYLASTAKEEQGGAAAPSRGTARVLHYLGQRIACIAVQ